MRTEHVRHASPVNTMQLGLKTVRNQSFRLENPDEALQLRKSGMPEERNELLQGQKMLTKQKHDTHEKGRKPAALQ